MIDGDGTDEVQQERHHVLDGEPSRAEYCSVYDASDAAGQQSTANPIDFDASNGVQFLDVLNLSGTSSVPLRNANWSIVNISGQTPTTLLNGPFLTSVQPVSEDQFSWNLVVDVPNRMHMFC